jgi:broad specificity phosphatase PhoE
MDGWWLPKLAQFREESMRLFRYALLCVAMLLPAPAMAAPIYVTRHMDRAPGEDPSLNEKGAARARMLADILAQANIKAVFATATKRAQETGGPLATRLGLTVTTYEPRDTGALATAVKAAGGPVLVVGHSNTVAALVAKFGGAKPAELSESDYGTLFIVHDGIDQVNRIDLP